MNLCAGISGNRRGCMAVRWRASVSSISAFHSGVCGAISLSGQRGVDFRGRFVQPQLHHRQIRCGLLPDNRTAEAWRARVRPDSSSSKLLRKCTSIRSPLWPSSENMALSRRIPSPRSTVAACCSIALRCSPVSRAPRGPAHPQHLMQNAGSPRWSTAPGAYFRNDAWLLMYRMADGSPRAAAC